MKTTLIAIALTLPTLTSAAEFLDVDCYIAEGTSVERTFNGYVFGTVKTVGERVLVKGKTIEKSYVQRTNTPDTCAPSYHYNTGNDGYDYRVEDNNVTVYEFDFSSVELSCALGSVVKKYGDLANFTKALEAQARRGVPTGKKPQCLDLTGLQ